MAKNLPQLLIYLLLALLGVATVAAAEPEVAVVFSDAIEVVDSLIAVPVGHGVRVRFPVGELEIVTAPVDSVETELEARCAKLSPALCDKYRRKLRLAADTRDGVVEVRLVGLPKWKLRKLRLDGAVTVPSRAPLEVQIGIGDVDIWAGEGDLTVRMGIGDLTVHALRERVRSVRAATRLGDAGVRGAEHAQGRRRFLGAVVDWSDGGGAIDIALALRIGDASVVLE